MASAMAGGALRECDLARLFFLFFFNDTATTEIYTLSLHDALPIWRWIERRTGADTAARRIRSRRARSQSGGTGREAARRRRCRYVQAPIQRMDSRPTPVIQRATIQGSKGVRESWRLGRAMAGAGAAVAMGVA